MADPTTSGTYVIIGRRAHVPLISDDDEVPIDNLSALELGLIAWQFQVVKNDPERAALYWGPNRDANTGQMSGKFPGAFDVLDIEREETEEAEVPVISFNRNWAAGNIPQVR